MNMQEYRLIHRLLGQETVKIDQEMTTIRNSMIYITNQHEPNGVVYFDLESQLKVLKNDLAVVEGLTEKLLQGKL